MEYPEVKGKYYIIFPAGDKSRLTVVFIQQEVDYEINDYAVASRKEFDDYNDANTYCRLLAGQHGLKFDRFYPNGTDKESNYLD